MTIYGHIQNGVIILEHQGPLPEGAAVEIQIIVPSSISAVNAAAPTLAKTLKDYIGALEDLPADASTNHDHYLYGAERIMTAVFADTFFTLLFSAATIGDTKPLIIGLHYTGRQS